MLRLEHVTRAYGRPPRRALDDVTLDVARGSLVALTGPNGAGKTTLLRLAATLDAPTRGRVLVDGLDAQRDGPAARARLAFLPPTPALYDALTLRENLAFVGAFYGRSRADIEHAAERAGVPAAGLDARASALSTGERQRVAFARALLGGELLLLDEPTTALDDGSRARVVETLVELRGERTMLVATHDEELAKRCDARARLDGGRLA